MADEFNSAGLRAGDRVSALVGATGVIGALVVLVVPLVLVAPGSQPGIWSTLGLTWLVVLAAICETAGVYYGRISQRSHDRRARRLGLATFVLAVAALPLTVFNATRLDVLLG